MLYDFATVDALMCVCVCVCVIQVGEAEWGNSYDTSKLGFLSITYSEYHTKLCGAPPNMYKHGIRRPVTFQWIKSSGDNIQMWLNNILLVCVSSNGFIRLYPV